MGGLSRETALIQNDALGAVLIWRFSVAYREKHPTSVSPSLLLAFIVLPLVLHADSIEYLRGTRSSLRGYAEKFGQGKEPRADLLLSIHDRVASWRMMSLAAIRLGVRSRLVSVGRGAATLVPLSEARPSGVPESVRPLLKASEKLGRWCSELSLLEIASILKVVF